MIILRDGNGTCGKNSGFFSHCNFDCPKFRQAKVEGGEKRVKFVTDGINIMMFCAVERFESVI